MILRPLDDRPVSRATCWSSCRHCHSQVPSCRPCAERRECQRSQKCCGPAYVSYDNTAALDSDADDDIDSDRRTICNALDVRSNPPRFTPLSRTRDVLPGIWSDVTRGWWLPSDADTAASAASDEMPLRWCTSCDRPTSVRWLVELVMVINGLTHRYQHKFCLACARCVLERPVSIQAATMCEAVSSFHLAFAAGDRGIHGPMRISQRLYLRTSAFERFVQRLTQHRSGIRR